MELSLLVYVVLFGLSGVACLASIPRARTIQHSGTRNALIVFFVSAALWCGGYLGYLLAPTTASKVALYTIGFISAFVAVGAWVCFCVEYTGRSVQDMPFLYPALAVFLFFIVLKITNPLHNLYFTTEWTTEPFPHLAINHQLLYWVVLGLSYSVIMVGFFMLAERLYHTGTDSRPLAILFGITGVPALATILSSQVETLLPLMYEPPGVAVFAVGTLFVYFDRFEAIRLTGGATDPTIYLDQSKRVRDYNQAAEAIFPALTDAIGDSIDDISSTLADHISEPGVVPVTENGETRYYEVTTTSFLSGEIETGRLVTITDVTDRETYRKQLEQKTEQLEALNRVVRHDIRNDMAVVLGWAETLRDHVDEDGEAALEHVLQSSSHVVELTDTARVFVESLTGDSTVKLKPVNLRSTIEAELTTVQETHFDAHFEIVSGFPQVTVQANEMLSSVFRNLLGNAVRHNDKAVPEITVTGCLNGNSVQIRVADNGPGIPDEQKEHIFGKGEKGVDSPGSGIGLYLVYTLMDQFDGDVWVEDNEPTGSVFVVKLPIHDPTQL
ncbi:sensor histidine kinase [Natrinema ejinorense]|uniref:Histidine kinase n=1 Tax=Natrinema ejinorense TaxID=373386 RepID=A0A2A5QUT3_9EURY|nr:ATP-binding protein [Natrinema ejinorense]PCR90587.1 histidine kinase [Natrinema ejinorense]